MCGGKLSLSRLPSRMLLQSSGKVALNMRKHRGSGQSGQDQILQADRHLSARSQRRADQSIAASRFHTEVCSKPNRRTWPQAGGTFVEDQMGLLDAKKCVPTRRTAKTHPAVESPVHVRGLGCRQFQWHPLESALQNIFWTCEKINVQALGLRLQPTKHNWDPTMAWLALSLL